MANANTPDQQQSEGPSHCGSKPKKIAFGIAPLGFISIGVVPMGIVTIGIVPMGVVSLGVVAMGVVNASIVGMGIFSAGITTMGLKVWSPEGAALQQTLENSGPSSKNIYAYPTRARAEAEAKKFGCLGVHKMGNLWMPCATHGTTQ
ncbi:hypothetical protein [Prochlorococcus sp. MIT 1307]|uniref:hypothetical protein n=1 Tax=Prochlorococcus sp. MIT 1307 TaxID=3096219 RepID=UPI002A7663DE|nr:hypothetical protein [Prochlorococcus sp. MIT 1307]